MKEKQNKWRWGDEIDSKSNKLVEEEEHVRTYSSVEELIKNEPDIIVEIIPNDK